MARAKDVTSRRKPRVWRGGDRDWRLIGHVRIRNAPSPLEPGVGKTDLFSIVEVFGRAGLSSPLGLEFDTRHWAVLRWMQRYGYREQTARAAVRTGIFPPTIIAMIGNMPHGTL